MGPILVAQERKGGNKRGGSLQRTLDARLKRYITDEGKKRVSGREGGQKTASEKVRLGESDRTHLKDEASKAGVNTLNWRMRRSMMI